MNFFFCSRVNNRRVDHGTILHDGRNPLAGDAVGYALSHICVSRKFVASPSATGNGRTHSVTESDMENLEEQTMKRMKKLATQNPIVFGLIIFLGLFLTVIISALLANQWPTESPGWYVTATAVRVVSIIILLALLSGLGWLREAGFLRLGRPQTWLLIILPLTYAIVVTAYAMTGNLDFSISESGLRVTVALFIITAAFLEEIAFRGLILHAFVRVWGETKRSLVKAVLVAALFFGAYHLINILGGSPLPEVLLQSAANVFMGIFLGGLVLYGRSLYPVVFFHACWNMAGYLNLTGSPAWGSSTSWLMLTVLYVPLAVFGLYLLRDVRQCSLELETA